MPGFQVIAEKAALENTGARGLLTVCENVLREFKYELPSSTIRQFVVTRELVANPSIELQRILREPAYEQRAVKRQCVREYERKFATQHNLKITFTDEATEEIIDRAVAADKSVSDLCSELFRDYQFGLNLIKTNSGQSEFLIPKEALENPDKFLSEWVVRSYPHKRLTSPTQAECSRTLYGCVLRFLRTQADYFSESAVWRPSSSSFFTFAAEVASL